MNSDNVIDEYMTELLKTLAVPEKLIKDQKILATLLKKTISREDGEFLIKLGKDGGTEDELSKKLNMDRKVIAEKLNKLFVEQGIVHPVPYRLKDVETWKPTHCLLLHDLVYIHPRFRIDEHEELFDLLDEYYETIMGPLLGKSQKTLLRVIPVNEAISTSGSQVMAYEEVANIVNDSQRIGLAECVCRKRAHKHCNHPIEVCLSFDMAADMMITRKIARKISKEKAFEILKISEEAGLVHCVDNRQKGLEFICNCCSCACGAVRTVSHFGYKKAVTPSRYQAILDSETCTGCGTCLDKCQFNAMALEDDKAVIDQTSCWGCGNCAAICPEGAIIMKAVRQPDHVPENGPSFMGF